MTEIKGQCMCGAVTVRAMAAAPVLRACHCDMCRRWCSSMYMSVPTDPASVKAEGPVRIYRSSEWAERAFCETCGSSLWYMTLHDQTRQLAAGLFDDTAGHSMKIEFFADRCPPGYALAGGHRKLSTAETIAMFAPAEGSDEGPDQGDNT